MNTDFKQAHADRFAHAPAAADQNSVMRRAGEMHAVHLDDQSSDPDQMQGIKEAIQESLDQAFGSSN